MATPNATPEGPGKKKNYHVIKNLRHDGKGFAPGSKVSLSDAHAAPLLKNKTVSLTEPETETQE